MPPRLLSCITLLTLALLLIVTEPARAEGGHDPTSGTLVDGYTVTFSGPTGGAQTGSTTVVVTLRDALGRPLADAGVSASLLAYLPAEGGHGETHGAASTDSDSSNHTGDAQGHAAMPGMSADMPGMSMSDAAPTDNHTASPGGDAQSHEAMPGMATDMPGMEGMSDMPGMTAAPTAEAGHAAAAETSGGVGHDHSGASATEGQGLMPIPVALKAAAEPGSYQGALSFDKAGTYTVGVVFVTSGQEHGATFDLAVAQSRPRGLVLGGFALVNAAVLGTAAVLRRRAPRKPAKSPAARPTGAAPAATSTQEQPQ